MIHLGLADLDLFKLIAKRAKGREPVAQVMVGLLPAIAGDAQVLLENVRSQFPSYTEHNFQHALRLLHRVSDLLGPDARAELTSMEAFILILSALFHDAGMASDGGESQAHLRAHHPERGAALVARYLAARVPLLSEYNDRIARHAGFVIEAHGLTWDDMVARPGFGDRDRVYEQVVRPGVLAVLLRLGDLLDLDSERSPDVLRQCLPGLFRDATSLPHHARHKGVRQFDVRPDRLVVRVECGTRQEHQLWTEWLGYLRQDVLNANTFVFQGALDVFRLPKPELSATPSPGARYTTWELRFELDEGGRLWNLISRSIYTARFDYVRELVQNGIDAVLMRAYADPSCDLPASSPRSWGPCVPAAALAVAVSESAGELEVADGGTGMTKEALERFLFRVAESGYEHAHAVRPFRFPSIAKFGIGFVSVLTRASSITIDTRAAPPAQPALHGPAAGSSDGYRVVVNSGSREAFVETHGLAAPGTRVRLRLNTREPAADVIGYLERTFRYASVGLVVFDRDAVTAAAAYARNYGIAVEPSVDAFVREGLPDGARDLPQLTTGAERLHTAVAEHRRARGEERGGHAAPLRIARRPLGRMLEAPLALALTERLEFGAVAPASRAALAGPRSIVWVPVAFDDYEHGVEWRSVHGFLVREGWIVTRLDEPGVRDAARPRGGLPDRLGVGGRAITHAPDGLHLYGDRDRDPWSGEGGDPVFGRGVAAYLTAESVARGSRSGGAAGARFDQLELALATIDELFRDGRGTVYQDGIRLPLAAAQLAPIGAYAAEVNLTAGGRFELNASRATVDESPGALAPWFQTTGSLIQRRVLDAVLSTLREHGVRWAYEDLYLPKADRSEVVAHAGRTGMNREVFRVERLGTAAPGARPAGGEDPAR